MLQALHIENIAVIRAADIEFGPGFSVLTGETGAGKSILIDSINFLLGQRTGRELLRTGTDRAQVSALFTGISTDAAAQLREVGIAPDENGELLLTRTLGADGRSTAKADGRPVSLSILKTAGAILVNIHGQSDTHTLTAKENHIGILDGYAEAAAPFAAYAEPYGALCEVRRQIREISESEAERLREAEMLRWQIADIEATSPRAGEEEKLEEKRTRIRHLERISRQTGFAYRALKGGEKANALYILERSIAAVTSLTDVIPEAAGIAEELEDCRSRIEDAAERISAFSDEDGEDAAKKLDAIETRLNAIERLGRKYGGKTTEILAFCGRAKERLALLEGADESLPKLKREEAALTARAAACAEELHACRAAAARTMEARVLKVLEFLDMPKVRFQVAVRRRTEGEDCLQKNGGDEVEFLLAANPGDPLQPLAGIASGGELARIMLALKTVIADKDGVGTVIYDEIDAGVSGKTARKLGIELLRSAKTAQVFCVTHSAQIASLADLHYLIRKTEKDGRAETEVGLLDEEGRIAELSRILGGIEVTEAQRLAARELYTERSVYKEG